MRSTLLLACLKSLCQFEQNVREKERSEANTFADVQKFGTLHVTGFLVMILVSPRDTPQSIDVGIINAAGTLLLHKGMLLDSCLHRLLYDTTPSV